MSTQNTKADYGELTNEVYALLVDAFGSTDKRALNFWKSVWDITSRPYTPVTIDSVVRTNLERANQLTNLTIGEMQSVGREAAEFAEKLLAEGAKVQATSLGSFRRLLDTYAANLNYVKETTSATLDDLSRRLDALEKRTVTADGSEKWPSIRSSGSGSVTVPILPHHRIGVGVRRFSDRQAVDQRESFAADSEAVLV